MTSPTSAIMGAVRTLRTSWSRTTMITRAATPAKARCGIVSRVLVAVSRSIRAPTDRLRRSRRNASCQRYGSSEPDTIWTSRQVREARARGEGGGEGVVHFELQRNIMLDTNCNNKKSYFYFWPFLHRMQRDES